MPLTWLSPPPERLSRPLRVLSKAKARVELSGATATYTAPNNVPVDGHDTVTCSATSAAGTATAQIVANVETSLAGYDGPVPSTFFGLHYINTNSYPSVSFGANGKMPGTGWPNLEPANGQYSWALLDQFVANANAHGIGVMYSSAGVSSLGRCEPVNLRSYYLCWREELLWKRCQYRRLGRIRHRTGNQVQRPNSDL